MKVRSAGHTLAELFGVIGLLCWRTGFGILPLILAVSLCELTFLGRTTFIPFFPSVTSRDATRNISVQTC